MKTLIIGANGFTGRRILQNLSQRGGYELTGCSLHGDIAPGDNYRFVRADINDHAMIAQLMDEIRPEVVINGSALSVPDYCELHHEEAYAANVLAVENIARCCENREAALSTCLPISYLTERTLLCILKKIRLIR